MKHKRLVIAGSLAAALVPALQFVTPISFVVVFAFLMTCPGASLTGALNIDDPVLSGVLLVGTSLAFDAIVAEFLLYTGLFSGARAIGILAAVSVITSVMRKPAVDETLPVAVNARYAGGSTEPIELDRDVPVLLVRIGHYPVHHGGVAAVRTFGRAGVPVHAVVEDRFTPSAVSRYLTGAEVWVTDGSESEQELLEGLARIGKRLGGDVLAIPCDDEAAVFLAEHAEILDHWFRLPAVTPDLPRRLASKRGLFEMCTAHGVPTPAAVFPQTIGEIRSFAARATFPVVAKNVDPFVRLQHKAVDSTTVIHSADELLELAATFSSPTTVMLQEYIPHEVAEDWIFHAYCDQDSRALVAFTGVKLRSWPAHAGVTSYARAVPNPTLEALSTKFLHDIGYCGVADLDWRFDRRDGRYKLVDFNPRMGANFKMFETVDGIDVLRAMHLDLTNRAVPSSPSVAGRGYRVENLDLASYIAYKRGHANAPAGATQGPRAQLAWLATDDPLPFFAMTLRFTGPVLRKALHQADETLRTRLRRPRRGDDKRPVDIDLTTPEPNELTPR